MRCSKGFVWTNKSQGKKQEKKELTVTTRHTQLWVLWRMSRGGEVLKQWSFSIMCGTVRGSLWPRQIQQDFHPKHGAAAAASLTSGGITAFSPCWLSWGINLTMLTQCSFVWAVGRAKVWWRENPATVLVDFNMDMQPHPGPPRVWLASFALWHWAVMKLHPYSKKSGQHIHRQPWPYLFITPKLQKYCSLYMAE